MIKPILLNQSTQVYKIVTQYLKNEPSFSRWSELQIEEELKNHFGVGYFEGDQLLGFVLYHDMSEVNEVTLLATDESFAKRGIMTQLMKFLQKKECWVEVSENNTKAIALYEKRGFIKSGERKDYYKDGSSAFNFTFKPC